MKRKILFFLTLMSLLLVSCSNRTSIETINKNVEAEIEIKENVLAQSIVYEDRKNDEVNKMKNSISLVENMKNKYNNSIPTQWGENVKGVISKIDTQEKIIALTFDACGEGAGNGYDNKLIDYLVKEKIPATLFINARWIDANLNTFKILAENSLFEIENHGYSHKPLSINGKSIYNIKGTASIEEAVNEVYLNEQKIKEITGRKPKYFRSGTAYYDDISVNIVKELGEKPVNFNVIGDAGATFSADQIKKASLAAGQGSIIIYHMNHPEKATADGIMRTIPLLKEKGFKFVKLQDYDEYLK